MNLIKGYLPIRIILPIQGGDSNESTFMFVKQHVSYNDTSARTLFVTNTPIYPFIRTNILLRALFEKFADVEKIIVAPKPRKNVEEKEVTPSMDAIALSLFEKEIRSFGGDSTGMTFDIDSWFDQGRYAHVIFRTTKDLKRFMSVFTKKSKEDTKNDPASVKFGNLELRELQDVSLSKFEQDRKKMKTVFSSEELSRDNQVDYDKPPENEKQLKGFMKLVELHKDRIPSHDTLKKICEKIILKYEDEEMESQRRHEAAKNQPDEDGFITVSYSNNVGDVTDFEKNGTLGKVQGRRGRERSRSRKKKDETVQDFYRFQMKESKKRHTEDLKNRFQDDLKKVKQMKEEKMYRPF